MPELGQPEVLERLLFWARTAGVFFLLVGFLTTFAAGWLSSRLDTLRKADLNRLEEKVQQLESRPAPVPVTGPAAQPAADETAEAHGGPPGRQVTPEQHRTLIAQLRSLEDTKVVLLTTEDYEASIYANQIVKTLRAAGLNVRIAYMPQPKPLDEGVTAYWSKADQDRAVRIIAAMRDAGIDLKSYRGMPMGGASLEIHVVKAPEETMRAREGSQP
jgi:hypothetical protein